MRYSSESTRSSRAPNENSPCLDSEDLSVLHGSKLSSTPPASSINHRDFQEKIFIDVLVKAIERKSRKHSLAENSKCNECTDLDELIARSTELSISERTEPTRQRRQRRNLRWVSVTILLLTIIAMSTSAIVMAEHFDTPKMSLAGISVEPIVARENTFESLPPSTSSVNPASTTASPASQEPIERAPEATQQADSAEDGPARPEPSRTAIARPRESAETPATERDNLRGEMVMRLREPRDVPSVHLDCSRTLSWTQVVSGIRRVTPQIRNCTTDGQNRVVTDITIQGNTGRVIQASIRGPLAGTVAGDCVVRAIRRAQFPCFNDSTLNVTSYPIHLRFDGRLE